MKGESKTKIQGWMLGLLFLMILLCSCGRESLPISDSTESEINSVHLEAEKNQPANGFLWYQQNDGIVLFGYQGDESVLTIPETINNIPVVTLGESFLNYAKQVHTVYISDTVQKISYAFDGCNSLQKVVLGKAVREMAYAFRDCTALESVSLQEGILDLQGAFEGCSSLRMIKLPKGVISAKQAFKGCGLLQTIQLNEELQYASEMFYGCTSLSEVILPKSLKDMRKMFYGCTSLRKVSEGPESIYSCSYAYTNCSSLEEIILPDYRFDESAYIISGDIYLEEKETLREFHWVEEDEFFGCLSLKRVEVGDGYRAKESPFLMLIEEGSLEEVVLPETLYHTVLEYEVQNSVSRYNGEDIAVLSLLLMAENLETYTYEAEAYVDGDTTPYNRLVGDVSIRNTLPIQEDNKISLDPSSQVAKSYWVYFRGGEELSKENMFLVCEKEVRYICLRGNKDRLKRLLVNGKVFTNQDVPVEEEEGQNIEALFYSRVKKEDVVYRFDFQDSFLLTDATKMNYDFIKASAALAASAYRKEYIADLLKQMGFEVVKQVNYDVDNSNSDRVAYTIGLREISDGEKTYRVYGVFIRGTSGSEEWYSNFDIGEEGTMHQGFYQAAISVYEDLRQTVTSDSEHTILWLTGHSRGAAVANVLGGILNREQESALTDEKRLFVYTFACPSVTTEVESFSNIFNFNNKEDVITKIPLTIWGFGRYGTTIEYTVNAKVGAIFQWMTGVEYDGNEKATFVLELMSILGQIVPTRSAYYQENSAGISIYDLMQKAVPLISGEYNAWQLFLFTTAVAQSGELIESFVSKYFNSDGADVGRIGTFTHHPETYLSYASFLYQNH